MASSELTTATTQLKVAAIEWQKSNQENRVLSVSDHKLMVAVIEYRRQADRFAELKTK